MLLEVFRSSYSMRIFCILCCIAVIVAAQVELLGCTARALPPYGGCA